MSDRTREVAEGDAFDLLADLPDDYGHAAVVDYPWEFDQENGDGRYGYEEEGDTIYAMESSDRLVEVFDELARALVDGAWVLCMADDEVVDEVRAGLRASDLTFRRNWAWTPERIGMGYYGRIDHYPIPTATNGDTRRYEDYYPIPTATNGDTKRYVMGRGTLYKIPKGRQTEYPTGKPVELYRQLLAPPVLEDGERLLEPFCGSAPGAKVAVERDLDYWGADISEEALSFARKRLEQSSLTGF